MRQYTKQLCCLCVKSEVCQGFGSVGVLGTNGSGANGLAVIGEKVSKSSKLFLESAACAFNPHYAVTHSGSRTSIGPSSPHCLSRIFYYCSSTSDTPGQRCTICKETLCDVAVPRRWLCSFSGDQCPQQHRVQARSTAIPGTVHLCLLTTIRSN